MSPDPDKTQFQYLIRCSKKARHVGIGDTEADAKKDAEHKANKCDGKHTVVGRD